MRKALAAFLTMLVFTFAGGGSLVSAQGPTLPAEQADDEDEGFDTGLVGLLGLFGLMGLRKRKRSATRSRAAR
jgi:MYXO-CTERM domain-containing protein